MGREMRWPQPPTCFATWVGMAQDWPHALPCTSIRGPVLREGIGLLWSFLAMSSEVCPTKNRGHYRAGRSHLTGCLPCTGSKLPFTHQTNKNSKSCCFDGIKPPIDTSGSRVCCLTDIFIFPGNLVFCFLGFVFFFLVICFVLFLMFFCLISLCSLLHLPLSTVVFYWE